MLNVNTRGGGVVESSGLSDFDRSSVSLLCDSGDSPSLVIRLASVYNGAPQAPHEVVEVSV